MLHLNQRSRLEPRPIRFVAPEPCCVALPTPVGGYFLIEANSDLGWKSFDSGLVGEAVVGTGTGCGVTMTGSGKLRSEERRVGKEGRSRWSPDHLKKKKKNKHIV